MRTFAIGDIHGRFDLLCKALAHIESQPGPATVIFLGDYIDRGPQSAAVVEALMAGPKRDGDTWVCLRGNHEEMMLEVHQPGMRKDWWLDNGGEAALRSWGGSVPEGVMEWCRSLPITHETDNYFFVHAGVRPRYSLAEQKAEEMLWIRDPFLRHEGRFEKHIVHGHTPKKYDQGPVKSNRTNLDSGAFFTGILSVAEIELNDPSGPQRIVEISA